MTNQIHIGCNHIWVADVEGSLDTDVLNDNQYDEHHSFLIHRTNINTQLCNDINTIVSRCSTIQNICLMHCTISDMSGFMSVIARNSTIRCLSMGSCSDIDETGMMHIADRLSNNIQLTRLHVNHTNIGDIGFKHIMKSLITNTTIKEFITTDANLDGTTDIIIENIPMIKSLRTLATDGFVRYNMIKLYDALSKNYSLECFHLYNGMTGFTIEKFTLRNKYIRTQALRELLDLVILLAPLIRVYKRLDVYCMMWIYEWTHEYNIHVNEFKKIRVIKSVFEFYRKKNHRENMSVVWL